MFTSPIDPVKRFDRTFFAKKLVYLKIFPVLCSVYLKTQTTAIIMKQIKLWIIESSCHAAFLLSSPANQISIGL